MQIGVHLSSPVVTATIPATNTNSNLGTTNSNNIPYPGFSDSSKAAAQLLRQQQQRAEESIVDDGRRLEREEAQEKDEKGYDDDDSNKSKNLVRLARDKDSIRVARPQAREEFMQQYSQQKQLADKDGQQQQELDEIAMLKARDAHMRQFAQQRRETNNNMDMPGKSGMNQMLQDRREDNTQQFAKHIHFNERDQFGDLDESIGIELNFDSKATLPYLVSNLFKLNGETAVPFIFSAWVQLDPAEADEKGSKCILSVGPELKDCDYDSPIMKGEYRGGNSSMIRFYVNHDGTADEELVLDWSPGAGRGCYSIASYGYQVPMRKWNHVAFSIDPTGWAVKLYINGELVAEEVNKNIPRLSTDVTKRTQVPKLVSDSSYSDSLMFLGRAVENIDNQRDLSMPLDGRIALVSVWSHNNTINSILDKPDGEAELLSEVYALGHGTTSVLFLEGVKPFLPDYFYPLSELDNMLKLGVLKDVMHFNHGTLIVDKDHTEKKVDKPSSEEGSLESNEQHRLTNEGSNNGFLPGIKRIMGQSLHLKGQISEEGQQHHLRGFHKELHAGNPFQFFVPKGGRRYEEYKSGATPNEITPDMIEQSNKIARERREYVRDAMIHAWSSYRKYAFGADELLPLSKKPSQNWGGVAATLVDALDTLWLMGLREEFWEARDWVRDKLSYDDVGAVSVFETTIRSLGGLLSAYDLSGDPVFLEKADDLGSRLIHAFETPNGIPYGQTELKVHKSYNAQWQKNKAVIAEAGTLQMEFRFLAHATKKQIYAEKVNKVFDILADEQPASGLYPLYVRNDVPQVMFSMDKASLGAMGDSLYEYMLKTWLQGGEIEEKYRRMFDKAMDGVHDKLVQKSSPDGLTYVADLRMNKLDHKMDHLACFMGGTWALGAYTNPDGLESPKAQRDLAHAKALTYTCYQMYARFPTGLSPEFVRFDRKPVGEDFSVGTAPSYLLRPEVVESLFVLNVLTGDPVYREWGWEIFQAIERFCRTDTAFGQLKDVRKVDGRPQDKMESFFLAETLKYLYLLFDPETPIDILNTHVFNTEAHPLRRFDRLEELEFEMKKSA
jgi:hypothetical protein